MGSFTESKSRGIDLASAADMVAPGSILKAMPGDVPKTTPVAMVKPFKQKVIKAPNYKRVVAKGGKKKLEAPNDLARHKGIAPTKEGKIIAGGPGSGRHPEDLIDQSHKHMYELYTRPTGKAGDPDLNVTKVTGNSGAHAIKRFKEANPGIKGGNNAHHIASKAPDGTWRVPTVSVKGGSFGALPISQWHHMKD